LTKKKKRTAGELYAELAQDADRCARRDAEEVERHRRTAKILEEQRDLIDDLARAGVFVRGVSDLMNRSNRYDRALPVLVRHLNSNREYSDDTLEAIVRALTCDGARGLANESLIGLFRTTENENLRWAAGNALSVVAESKDTDELRSLLTDPSYGEARNMLPHALVRLLGDDAAALLVSLLEDRCLTAELLTALGELKAEVAEEAVDRYVDDPDSWIRGKARSAKKKLNRTAK
jgi:hypothetical protein